MSEATPKSFLPFDILWHIATLSPRAFCDMLAVPSVARYAKMRRDWLMNHFTIGYRGSIDDESDDYWKYESYLPNGNLHSKNDKPADWTSRIAIWYKNDARHRTNKPARIGYKLKKDYCICICKDYFEDDMP